jgi:hypothetical protein
MTSVPLFSKTHDPFFDVSPRALPCRNISVGLSAFSLYLQHPSFCFEMDSAYAHVRCASFFPLKKAVVLRHGFSRALLCRNISVATSWPVDSEISELKIYGLVWLLFFKNRNGKVDVSSPALRCQKCWFKMLWGVRSRKVKARMCDGFFLSVFLPNFLGGERCCFLLSVVSKTMMKPGYVD